jgi:hypothetical protein
MGASQPALRTTASDSVQAYQQDRGKRCGSAAAAGEEKQFISRATAKRMGLKTYFTGQPCKRGGVAERKVSSRNCLCPACMKPIAQADREYQARRYLEQKAAILERDRQRYQRDREKILSRRSERREHVREAGRRHYANNRSSVLDRRREYRETNPYIVAALTLRA